jgi:uncharacterized protein
MIQIDLTTARRYILGKQGLWPGRRWRATKLEQAMRAMDYVQLDPLQIIARSHDIALHSRVLGYAPDGWEKPAYKSRAFFDWGGWLAVRPMDELPYWRTVMRRERESHPRVREMGRAHADAIVEMRQILRDTEMVSNRDFESAARMRTQDYRGRKDSALALYYLWRTGEVMTHHRERFERVYALTERVAPAALIHESSDAETDRFLVLKEIAFHGLARITRTAEGYQRGEPDRPAKRLIPQLLADGELVEVRVEGWKQLHVALASDAPLIADLAAGRVPKAWRALDTTTTDEAVFLAPLDQVSARGRASTLFGFDYVWEVYKPAPKRKHGYYVLPVLWGDQLVARFDSKLDRTTNTFVVLGFWLEDPALGKNAAFAEALGRGFERFCAFLGAESIDARAIQPRALQTAVAKRR